MVTPETACDQSYSISSSVPVEPDGTPMCPPSEGNPRSAIHSLPTEILAGILFSCVNDDWETQPLLRGANIVFQGNNTNRVHWHRVPWVLSHVCAMWREITLNFAKFWSFIIIRPDLATTKRGVDGVRFSTLTMLERSRDWPLHLSLLAETDAMDDVQMFNHWLLAFQLLMDHSNRWRVVRFMLSSIFVKHLDLVRDRIGRLEDCLIHVRETINNVNERFDVLNSSQSLRKLDVWGLPLTPTPATWPQLTHYTGAFFPFTQLRLIQTMPMLTHLTMSRVSAIITTLVTCERLTHICIPDHSTVFLSCLILPALQYLQAGRVRQLDPIVSVIQRSGCSLQTLNLTIINPISKDAIRSLLVITPHLTSLLVEDEMPVRTSFNHHLFQLLSPNPTEPLVPNLFELSVRFRSGSVLWDQTHDGHLVQLLRSRWPRQGCLQPEGPFVRLGKVHLKLPASSSTLIPTLLEQFRSEGLDCVYEEVA